MDALLEVFEAVLGGLAAVRRSVEVVAVAAAEAATDAAATEAAERARVPPTLRAAPGAGSRVVVGFTSVGGVWCPGVPTPLVEGGASIGTSARRFGAGGGPSGRG